LETLTIGGVQLAYWGSGDRDATTLVMLHGLASDHTGLLDLAGCLPGFRVIVPDLPGFGRSQPHTRGHTIGGYVRVLESLRRRLGIGRFVLLGHSLGAAIALAYASTHRAAVHGLCLVNPVFAVDNYHAWISRLYYDLCCQLPIGASRLLLTSSTAVRLSDRALFTTQDPRKRARILLRDCAAAALADPRAVRESYLSLRGTPFDRYARRVRSRTLLITGTQDVLARPRSLTGLPWRAPRPRLEVVSGAGHLLPTEHPEVVARLVRRFLLGRPAVRSAPPVGGAAIRAAA
jgi:pimeloyl-ACP methyl ester carboxylesterase